MCCFFFCFWQKRLYSQSTIVWGLSRASNVIVRYQTFSWHSAIHWSQCSASNSPAESQRCEILWTGAEKGSRDFIGCPHAGRIANAFLGWAMNGYHIMRYHTLVEKDKTFFLWLLHSKRAEIPIKFLRTQDVLISHNFACLSKTPTRREIRHQTDLILTYLIQIDFEFSNCGFCIPSASTLVHSCYSSSSATWRWRVSTRASIGGLWEWKDRKRS